MDGGSSLVAGNSRERSEDVSILGRKAEGEALHYIFSTICAKHYHVSTAQFKKRTTHLHIPGKVYDIY